MPRYQCGLLVVFFPFHLTPSWERATDEKDKYRCKAVKLVQRSRSLPLGQERSSMIGSNAAVGSGPWPSAAWKHGSQRIRRMVVKDHAHYLTYGALWVTELSCDPARARGLRGGGFRRGGEYSSTIRIRALRLYDGHRHVRSTLTGRDPILGCLCVDVLGGGVDFRHNLGLDCCSFYFVPSFASGWLPQLRCVAYISVPPVSVYRQCLPLQPPLSIPLLAA